MKKIICLTPVLFVLIIGTNAQTGSGWSVKGMNNHVFVENKGQFNKQRTYTDKEILYAFDNGGTQVYFTKNGVIYRFYELVRNPEHKRDRDGEDKDKKYVLKQEFVEYEWEGCNTTAQIQALEKSSGTNTYAVLSDDRESVYDIHDIPCYKKLLYKNLYPGIDVEFTFHPEDGLEYSLILHPGADVTEFKMKYTKGNPSINSDGNVIINTGFGKIKEHAPVSFYNDNKAGINSSFRKSGKTLSFDLSGYDMNKEVIIDPWVILPTLPNSNCVWECETDAAGNVYISGGESPMKVQKYNANGTWQWTYTTPWDTATVWLGTLATLPNGDCFVTSGTAPEMERINTTNGAMMWHTTGGVLIGGDDEWWAIAFNCDTSKMIIGGTKLFMMTFKSYAALFDLDMNNGNVLGLSYVDSAYLSGMGAYPIEVRSIASTRNGKYAYLTHTKVGIIDQAPGQTPAFVPVLENSNGHELAYKWENYMPATQNGAGIKAIAANNDCFYTHFGNIIYKWSVANAALLDSVIVPGGSNQTFLGEIVVHNSGLVIDACGNLYAGSGDRLVKYDMNLNLVDSVMLPFTVYDVALAPGGNVVVCGAEKNNTFVNRVGHIQQIAFSTCGLDNSECCNANFNRIDSLCVSDAPVQFQAYVAGGVWSGTGTGINSTGLFDPAVAGAGIHTITYTLACGSESINVNVFECIPMEVCIDSDTLMVAGGNCSTYTWQYYAQATTSPITNQAECESCGYNWIAPLAMCQNGGITVTTCNILAGWTTFYSGNEIPVPSQFPVRVTDGCGYYFYINNIGELDSLPPCVVYNESLLACSFSVLLIPNPSDGNQHLVINSSKQGPVKITVTDITGRRVAYYETTINKGNNDILVNDFLLLKSHGYYYLTVENGVARKTISLLQ